MVVRPFVLFRLDIVLSVLRYTDSDCCFGIVKLFLKHIKDCTNPGPGFPTPMSFLCSVKSVQMRCDCCFADIGGIDDHHSLHFLFINE